jgi:hypothetical protein
MSLWHLFHFICFSAVIGSSLSAARVHKPGFAGYSEAAALGIVLGLGSAWAMWTSGRALAMRIRRLPESQHESYFRLLYGGAMMWIIIASVFGFWVPFLALGLAP